MASSWYIHRCSKHGLFKRLEQKYDCVTKRTCVGGVVRNAGCSVTCVGELTFDPSSDTWCISTDGSLLAEETARMLSEVTERCTRAQYRERVQKYSHDELNGHLVYLLSNSKRGTIGPILAAELMMQKDVLGSR